MREKRYESNKKILELIGSVIEKYPDLRFWQIIYMFGFETSPDRFYDESYLTLKQIEAFIEQEEKDKGNQE